MNNLPEVKFLLCDACKQAPATIHLTQIVGDKIQKADLCDACGDPGKVGAMMGLAEHEN